MGDGRAFWAVWLAATATMAGAAGAAPAPDAGPPLLLAQADQYQDYYRVNGEAPPIPMQQMMMLNGLAPGDYYLEPDGDFGMVGQEPFLNVNGGQPLGRDPAAGAAPSPGAGAPVQTTPQAGAPAATTPTGAHADLVKEATGARIFWVYSPSIISGATGGSSGYVHLCPGGVAYRSSEGALSVGGDYNSEYGVNDSWAGVAHTSAERGRWTIEDSPEGPMLAVYNAEGGAQRVLVRIARQGRWTFGQTKYAIEANKASCP